MAKQQLKLAKIKQLFPHHALSAPEDAFCSLLKSSQFNEALSGRKRIAIAIGSRGISNLSGFVKQLVDHLKQNGHDPFIIPAMGSHGTACSEGQAMVLDKLGINKNTVKAEIISSMDVISIGEIQMCGHEYQAYVDRTAWQRADGVILVNRVKQHTDFTGKYESGLVKIASVGLGNQKGAEQIHSLGTLGLRELMPALAEMILKEEKLLGGFALIEDSYHDTAEVCWLNSRDIMAEEPGLLEKAKSLMPHFPITDIDLLIIKAMGKEISGAGIDSNVIGRMKIPDEPEPALPRIELIGVCDLTEASCGNALGVGFADFTTKQLFDKIDFKALRANILTSTFYERGKIPIVLEDEREMVEVCTRHFEKRGNSKPNIIVIKNTLNLSDIYVSEAVLEKIRGSEKIEIISKPKEIKFDEKNRIILF